MSKTKFQIHRSMFVQIVLLTVLVGSAAVYQYALRPYLDLLEEMDSARTPLEQTVDRLMFEVSDIVKIEDPTERAVAFEDSDVIAKVSAANPDMYFRYFNRGKALEFGTATKRYEEILSITQVRFDSEGGAVQCRVFPR